MVSIIQADPFANIIKPDPSVANAPFFTALKAVFQFKRTHSTAIVRNLEYQLTIPDHTVYADFSAARIVFDPMVNRIFNNGLQQELWHIKLQHILLHRDFKIKVFIPHFLDYKIDPEKTPNYNPDKSHVLLRIYKENYYATTKTSTYYNYTSSTIVIPNPSGSPEVRRPTNANQVFPIGANSVRMMAGDEDLGDYKTARSRIVSKSIILEIGEQQPENPQARELTIRAHDRVNDVEVDPVDVVQLTPIDDYDNTFLLNAIRTPDGRATYYKEFRLHYKYRLESTAPYREVKAKLRYEFNPRVDNL